MKKIDVKKAFGASVKVSRNLLGISQETLAERSELHRTYISDVERGARNPSLHSIVKLAGALEVSVASLFASALPTEKGPSRGHPRPARVQSFVDILLVEDNADDVELTLHAFGKARFANRVQVVTDGAAALDYLFYRGEHADRQPGAGPQVVLLDLGLPKMSGLEVLRCLKTDKRTAALPVVILTGTKDAHELAECRRLGAAHYIAKPVDFQGLSQVTPQLNLDWALLRPAQPAR